MALKKGEKRLLMLLAPVVLIFLLDQLGVFGKKSKEVIDQTKTAITKTVAKVAQEARSEFGASSPSSVKKYDTWGRDPFATPEFENEQAAARRAASALVLKGIFKSGDRTFVMINDVVLEPGQEKKGIRLESIEGRKVVCRRGGQTYTLQWRERK